MVRILLAVHPQCIIVQPYGIQSRQSGWRAYETETRYLIHLAFQSGKDLGACTLTDVLGQNLITPYHHPFAAAFIKTVDAATAVNKA
ncbi:hypothetical protein [Endozoicomonas ascidiicola]|uniref:hypothetical protein n=1 Tax=Endozoicomonas ascidiicola TaxID=1698521 RepID=UPI0015603494|nr:hypothetical protein [Endozoicomonas ascidiicola]